MAEKEEPIVDSDTGSLKVKEQKEKQPDGNETKGDVTKVKAKMKKKPEVESEEPIKVDLSKPAEEVKPEVEVQEVQPEAEVQESGGLEEITAEEVADVANAAIEESITDGTPLPENVQKLVDFIEETGGDLNDYVKLNKDYSEVDNQTVLQEYYKQTKPHLDAEEINFLMEDQFSFDEDVDEDREIRRKKLALKEQVASAKSHLDGQKSKYYQDIKAGSKLTEEQQKAVNFFDRYNKESGETQKIAEAQKSTFLNKTEQVFNDKFKGFEYNVGDKKYRFNVNNAGEVKNNQSDINNFVKKFLNKNNEMSDAKGYHKSLYTAMNPDAVAKHFYDQGKADAMKNSMAKAKNVDMNPRQAHGEIKTGGTKFKVLGDNSSDFKFKIKNNKFKK